MNLSQFQQAAGHGRVLDAGPGQAGDHGREIVAAVEAVFELGEVSWHVFGADGPVGAGDGGLDVAKGGREVLTHLKAGVFAAFGPEPVLTMAWLHPARVTAAANGVLPVASRPRLIFRAVACVTPRRRPSSMLEIPCLVRVR